MRQPPDAAYGWLQGLDAQENLSAQADSAVFAECTEISRSSRYASRHYRPIYGVTRLMAYAKIEMISASQCMSLIGLAAVFAFRLITSAAFSHR